MILDRAHFDMMTAGDRSLQLEVLGLFKAQVEGWTAALAQAGWRDAVHTLKGSARGIGLTELAAVCGAAEALPDAESEAALGEVRAALGRALEALEQFAAESHT